MAIGIYKIVNLSTNKFYVGQSVDLAKRKRQHMTALRNNKHKNKKMQADFNANPRSFRFSIVEKCSKNDMNDREIYWIKYYDSYKHGYNATIGGGYGREDEETKVEKEVSKLSPLEKRLKGASSSKSL